MPFNIGGHIYNGGIADPQDYYNILTRGLIMHLDASSPESYPGSGATWSDMVNSYNGSLINGASYNSAGGGSINFDGTNDYVGFSGTGVVPSGLSNASMTMWVNLTRKSGGGQQFQQVAGWRNDSNTDFFFLLLDSSGATVNTEARIRTSGGTVYDINVDFTSYFGTWTYVAFIVDTNRIDLYFNGSLVGSNTNKAGSFTNPGNDLRIGQNLSGGFPTQGNIANFTVYNRTLSAAEVRQNFNVQRSRFGI
jgi:hypothetical protein